MNCFCVLFDPELLLQQLPPTVKGKRGQRLIRCHLPRPRCREEKKKNRYKTERELKSGERNERIKERDKRWRVDGEMNHAVLMTNVLHNPVWERFLSLVSERPPHTQKKRFVSLPLRPPLKPSSAADTLTPFVTSWVNIGWNGSGCWNPLGVGDKRCFFFLSLCRSQEVWHVWVGSGPILLCNVNNEVSPTLKGEKKTLF